MLLTVDVGNTHIVFAFYENDQLLEIFRLGSKLTRTADELGLLLSTAIHRAGLSEKLLEAALISSVVPEQVAPLEQALLRYANCKTLLIDRDLFTNLAYKSEGQLGADRAVCCEAALSKYGGPLLLLDLGTATTLDLVDAERLYIGGCILTGMQVGMEALSGRTSLLPEIPLERPATFLGYDTVEQIQIGMVSGYLGGLSYLVRETLKEAALPDKVKVIATGGLAPLAAAHLPEIDVVDKQLISDGLLLLYARHKAAAGK